MNSPKEMTQDELAAEDLKRARADPQKYADNLGSEMFRAMYPELADQVSFVPAKTHGPVEMTVGPSDVELAAEMADPCGDGQFIPPKILQAAHYDRNAIPNEPTDGRMVGRLDPSTGKAVIEPATALVQGAMDDAQAIIDVEKRAQAALEQSEQLIADAEGGLQDVEEKAVRMQALLKLIADEKMGERGQIVAVIMAYATDCEGRAEQLELSGARERKRLRKTGHVQEAEQVREMQKARSAAFKVRAAISADLAYKIETGWGRKEDGSVQDKPNADESDLMKESARMNKEAAHLKTV